MSRGGNEHKMKEVKQKKNKSKWKRRRKKKNQEGNLIEESKWHELDEYGNEILKEEVDENVNENLWLEDEDYEHLNLL